MRRGIIAAAATAGAVLVLAGCGGAPAQPGSLDKPSTTPSSGGDAPKIAHPVDVSQFVQDPCALTSSSAMAKVGLHKTNVDEIGKRNDGQPNRICHWDTSESQNGVGVSLLGMGLDAQYKKQNLAHVYQKFQPTTVDGFPAVNTTKPDDEKDGRFSLTIGLNDRESADIQTTADSPAEAKKITDAVAKAIVSTARAGGK